MWQKQTEATKSTRTIHIATEIGKRRGRKAGTKVRNNTELSRLLNSIAMHAFKHEILKSTKETPQMLTIMYTASHHCEPDKRKPFK